MTALLEIKNLHVSVEDKEVVKGLSLSIKPGEIHALMGPNGTGKSTLGFALAGHPKYKVTSGEIALNGKNLLSMKPNERAHEGLFLGFQYPVEIQGVGISHFLYTLAKSLGGNGINAIEFRKTLLQHASTLGMTSDFLNRQLNVGFSGGEKKRAELLQLLVTKPKIAILDEPDSGTDVDTLKTLANAIKQAASQGTAIILITHYNRILQYVQPSQVYVMIDGKIVKQGSINIAELIEKHGYKEVAS